MGTSECRMVGRVVCCDFFDYVIYFFVPRVSCCPCLALLLSLLRSHFVLMFALLPGLSFSPSRITLGQWHAQASGTNDGSLPTQFGRSRSERRRPYGMPTLLDGQLKVRWSLLQSLFVMSAARSVVLILVPGYPPAYSSTGLLTALVCFIYQQY